MADTFYEFKICCKVNSPSEAYGPSITSCEEVIFQPTWDKKNAMKVGTLWVGNGEYDSQVNFCPVCGREAKVRYDKKRKSTSEQVE